MKRTLLVCAALFALAFAARAAGGAEPTETVIRMTVRPAAAPKPSLKYQLLPELCEMNPGNPIQAYFKCFAEQHNFWKNKEVVEKREKWQTMPLRDLPLEEIRKYGHARGYPLRYADYAARLDTPDWQILLLIKREGANLLLPDVQQLRELASALKVRFRVEIAERRFMDALATAKTLLALSRHLGEHPSLIGNMVGIAIAGYVTLSSVDELIQQPGCPNLFWALTDLPKPFIDLHKGQQGMRALAASEFAQIDDRAAMSETQLQKAIDRLRLLTNAFNVKRDIPNLVDKMAHDERHVEAARKRLIEAGVDANRIKEFPPQQVVLLEEKLEYETRRDDEMKGMSLPYWQAKEFFRTGKHPKRERKYTLFADLTTACSTAKKAAVGLDQRIALLRCVEALRIYAAEHDGKLPAKLEDIRLPLPVDPATGKPFSYKVDGKTAHLHGEPLGVEVRYEVTIGK